MKPLILLGLLTPISFLSSAPLPLIREGQPQAKIYLPPTPSATPRTPGMASATPLLEKAVEDLNYHIEKMTGNRLEVVRANSPDQIGGTAIILGPLAEKCGLQLHPTPFQNSLRILTKDNRLLIAGEKESATVNGIYTLLGLLGCEWVMPGPIGEVIPFHSELTVPELDLTETPSFAGRNLWYRGPQQLCTEQDNQEYALWCQRQRMDATGETPNFGAGHVWDVLIGRHKKEFEEDPTMLALIRDKDGTLIRKGPQLETTHPSIVELFVSNIQEEFAKNNWPKDKTVAFGIGPSDGLDFSLSSDSALAGTGRIDPLTGSPDVTDLCVLLGNQILSRIEKEYPNVSLGFYSYTVHGDYPLRYKPHPRLNQIFAPISFSRYHGPLAKNSKTWPYYKNIVEKWSALSKEQGNQLAYRGYNWNLAENMIPFSKLQIYGEEIPWYHDKGFVAVNIEATKAWAVNGPSDFLLAKLLWNSRQNWKSILKEYCHKSFGEGGKDMEHYFLNLTERQTSAGQEAGSYYAIHLIYDDAFVQSSRKLIESAVAKAQAPEEKARAGYFLYPLEQLDLYLKFRDAYSQFEFAKAAKYFAEIPASWERANATNTQIVAREVLQYLERLVKAFVTESVMYSSAPYRLVLPLPDQLSTQFDPTGVGEQMGFQNPDLNDALCLKTRTWSATWDAQGLGTWRTGSVWYRFAFDTPEDLKNQTLGLFIGGVEDQVDVWLNGQQVGSSPQAFSTPFTFDLSPALNRKGRNVLAMKVTRYSSINEIGLGGIIRPAFLFAGPRAEKLTPSETPSGRILPGGG